jgi:hypothetical protein
MMLVLLTACAQLQPWLSTETEPPEVVTLQGWVYDSPLSSETALDDGWLTYLDLNLVELAQGEQPFPDYPGYWRVELPAGEEYFLRVEGPDHYPALYRGQAPTGHGLTSALFGFEVGPTADFFAGVEEAVGLDIGLESPDLVHLWGVPNLGDEDSTVHCEDLAVLHNGAAASVVCFALNEDGVLAQTSAGPVDHFFAFNMLPGELIVRVTVGDEQLEELWFPQGGDIVAAWYFEGLR